MDAAVITANSAATLAPEEAAAPPKQLMVMEKKTAKSNPFAAATAVAAEAAAASPANLSAVSQRSLAIRTPSPLGEQKRQHSVNSRRMSREAMRKRFACCMRPAVIEEKEEESVGSNDRGTPSSATSTLSPDYKKTTRNHHWPAAIFSPNQSLRAQVLTQQGSVAYSDAEWFDARSEISSALSGMTSDHAAKLEELSAMLKELHPSPAVNPTVKHGPWIPEPALAFGTPDMQFMPVPAHTGFAAYWQRDQERSTPYPTPIDVMIKASALAMRSHASIPGIWLQETDKGFSVTVKPRFLPPGLPRYTETYDKTNATEPAWPMRRDLRLGTTSGQIFMTTDGMLVLRARSKPMFGSTHDFIMEEYMRLEEGGKVIVDRMCCVCVKSGNTATQYVVGHFHAVPPKGHV